jgi:hypothetical protein
MPGPDGSGKDEDSRLGHAAKDNRTPVQTNSRRARGSRISAQVARIGAVNDRGRDTKLAAGLPAGIVEERTLLV